MEALKDPLDYYMSPFLYMNQMYLSMVENVHSQISVSWSLYVQSDKGAVIVVRSEPALQLSNWNFNLGMKLYAFGKCLQCIRWLKNMLECS